GSSVISWMATRGPSGPKSRKPTRSTFRRRCSKTVRPCHGSNFQVTESRTYTRTYRSSLQSTRTSLLVCGSGDVRLQRLLQVFPRERADGAPDDVGTRLLFRGA